MKIKPLIQLRELIAVALKSQTNLSKSFQSFFKEAMELFLTTGLFQPVRLCLTWSAVRRCRLQAAWSR